MDNLDRSSDQDYHWAKRALIYLFLIMLIAGGTSYVISRLLAASEQKQPFLSQVPTPQPPPTLIVNRESSDSASTANWKTYKNQKRNFSIQYPNTLEYTEVIESSSNAPIIKNIPTIRFIDNNDRSEFPNMLIIRVFDKSSISTKQIEKSYFSVQGDRWKEINIGVYKGMFIEASGGAGTGMAAILEVNDRIFYFHLTNRLDNKYIDVQSFYQILATFKFLDNQLSISPTQTTKKSGSQVCIQLLTPARNPATGECREFPTPCDVPEGWNRVDSCASSQ